MRCIGRIFRQDLKSLTKNLIIFVVVIGITILPALYAWFNIASNWDPYSNTGELPFAVCSLDDGYEFKGIKINAGDSVVEGLKGNDKMGWEFVGADEAKNGVTDGKYYAAVIIPKNFSKNLLSIATGAFDQAKIEYYVNEKRNAIAPKITDKGVSAIQESVDATYVSTVAKTIATTLNITGEEIEGDKDKLSKKINTALRNTKGEIKNLSDSIDLLVITLNSVDSLLNTSKNMIPTVRKTLSGAGVMVNDAKSDVKTTLTAAKNTAGQLTNIIDGIIDAGDGFIENVSTQVNDAFTTLSNDANSAATKLSKIEVINQKKIKANNKLITIFNAVQDNLGINCSRVLTRLKNANDKQNAIIKKIETICTEIKTKGAAPKNAKADLDKLISDTNIELSAVSSEFSGIKKDVDNAVSTPFTSLDGVADFAQSVSTGGKQLETAFNDATTLNANLKKILKSLKTYLNGLSTKIDKVIKRVDELKGDKTIENMILPIIEDPEALGEFLSAPVSSNTHRVFPIENYGSAMTPFYSSLAIWVGGIVLVAVINVDLTPHDRKKIGKANSTQLFFGRYLMFFFAGQIQALIISLGDLFFLKVQCADMGLFIFGSLVSSFIYTLLIYSLTITFSVIGKALSVIILILQVAGSGGTFPIEVLPGPFKTLAPFLPFKYGITALREAIAGVDPATYWKNLGILLLYVIPALILGLLLRKPCIKIIAFFNEKIEESDLVI